MLATDRMIIICRCSAPRYTIVVAVGPTLKSYRHEAKKWVGGLEANFTKGHSHPLRHVMIFI